MKSDWLRVYQHYKFIYILRNPFSEVEAKKVSKVQLLKSWDWFVRQDYFQDGGGFCPAQQQGKVACQHAYHGIDSWASPQENLWSVSKETEEPGEHFSNISESNSEVPSRWLWFDQWNVSYSDLSWLQENSEGR